MTPEEAHALLPGDVLFDRDPVFEEDEYRTVVSIREYGVFVYSDHNRYSTVPFSCLLMKRLVLHRRTARVWSVTFA